MQKVEGANNNQWFNFLWMCAPCRRPSHPLLSLQDVIPGVSIGRKTTEAFYHPFNIHEFSHRNTKWEEEGEYFSCGISRKPFLRAPAVDAGFWKRLGWAGLQGWRGVMLWLHRDPGAEQPLLPLLWPTWASSHGQSHQGGSELGTKLDEVTVTGRLWYLLSVLIVLLRWVILIN